MTNLLNLLRRWWRGDELAPVASPPPGIYNRRGGPLMKYPEIVERAKEHARELGLVKEGSITFVSGGLSQLTLLTSGNDAWEVDLAFVPTWDIREPDQSEQVQYRVRMSLDGDLLSFRMASSRDSTEVLSGPSGLPAAPPRIGVKGL